MTSQVLYRKWRPQTLAQVVGQEGVTQTLLNALTQGRVGHAYLFTGPRGTGKTSTARILAKAVNCLGNDGRGEPDNTCSICQEINQGSFLDLIEIDAASNRGIDDIRELREKARFAPTRARSKVYIIDEAHMLTPAASDAFLKTLEEPPGHALFVLATTEPHKISLTIASRCQRFDFRRIRPQDAVERLRQICSAEGFQVEAKALEAVVKAATGSLRDAENLLEQLVLAAGPAATAERAWALFGIVGSGRGYQVVASILEGDLAAALRAINQFDQEGMDLRQVHREVVEELRALLLTKAGVTEALDMTPAEVAERETLVAATSLAFLRTALERFASLNVPTGSPPLPLEMAIVSCLLEMDLSQPAVQEAPTAAQQPAPPRQEVAPSERDTATPVAGPPRTPYAGAAPGNGQASPPQASAQASETPRPEPIARASTQASETPRPEPIPPGDITALQKRWKEVVDSLRGFGSNRNLDAILRSSSTPIAIEGDTLVIGFYHTYHKEKVEDPKYRHLVERRIAQFMGTHYHIRCVMLEQQRSRGHTVRAALERGARVEAGGEERQGEEGQWENE